PEEMIESGITDEGSDDQAEVKLERDDGRTRWIWMRRFPLSDRGGWILILTDITTRKTRERQLSRKNERLDRIAGVISHDLRNPMDVIKKRGKLARGAEEDFDSIERSVERMDILIEDMLQLARQGKDIDEREEVDIDSLAESAWHTVETRDAELSASSDIVASGDEGRLRQAFENLFRNSVEHAGDDVEIEVGRLEEKEGFYVEDDGPGIPPENLDEVFDYGWTDSKSGSGFGLAIVRDVVEAHGWKIEAVECERGARFEVFDVDSNPTSR
ncbi:MAG: HAMP domain-containing sensor histidine kinase, partial [Halobacteria archaeon]|nr:HAMP domain-containing sensor histidine kinase [Halobacteria archaeon]